MRNMLDLPQPFGPTMSRWWPAGTSKLSAFTSTSPFGDTIGTLSN